MPIKYRTGKKTRPSGPYSKRKNRKEFKGRSIPKPSGVLTNRGPSGIPDIFRTKLVFVQNPVTIATIGAATNVMAYVANGITDVIPGLAGGPRQPRYADQMLTLYTRYRVLGMKYEVSVMSLSTTIPGALANICVVPTGGFALTAVGAPTLDIPASLPRAQNKYVGLPSGNCVVKFKGYLDNTRIMGVKRSEYQDDDDFFGTVLANPLTNTFLNIWQQSIDAVANSVCIVSVRLKYYCEFTDRTNIGLS